MKLKQITDRLYLNSWPGSGLFEIDFTFKAFLENTGTWGMGKEHLEPAVQHLQQGGE
jgi:hypothetical protein